MNSMEAISLGEANRGKPLMVFDWDKAAQMIKASGVSEASAGLRGDWDYTGGTIFKDGKPDHDGYTYLASTWAKPELELDGQQRMECWKFQSDTPEWDAHTKWPDSAVAIIAGKALSV